MQHQVPCFTQLEAARSLCDRFYRDESGQDLIEYALLAAMVGLGSVSATSNLASAVANDFNHVSTAVANTVPSGAPASSSGSNTGGDGHHRDHHGG
ncbi:MAG TPA: Flp family type IVb pilin [Acidobacteriaceae bacterium]